VDIEALLGPITREQAEASGALRDLPVGVIRPNPFQPRSGIDEAALAELVASIEASGLLCSSRSSYGPRASGYELIAGRTRWRAVQRLGWATIPAVVRDADDQTLLTLALIENLQRNDLSPNRRGAGLPAADGRVHRPPSGGSASRSAGNRTTVANLLRLLKLPPKFKD
jgi:ParB family chromosome partitioning protein